LFKIAHIKMFDKDKTETDIELNTY